jgi:hypothetical protein
VAGGGHDLGSSAAQMLQMRLFPWCCQGVSDVTQDLALLCIHCVMGGALLLMCTFYRNECIFIIFIFMSCAVGVNMQRCTPR